VDSIVTKDDLRWGLEKLRQAVQEGKEQNYNATKQELVRVWKELIEGNLDEMQKEVGNWRRAKGFKTNWNNVPEKLMLIVTELSEAMEAYRHIDLEVLENKLPISAEATPTMEQATCITWWNNFEEEIADTVIRILDLCDALGIPLTEHVYAKMAVNELRPVKHGKQC